MARSPLRPIIPDPDPFDLIKAAQITAALFNMGLDSQRVLQNYPGVPAQSTYRRTGTLGRRWTTRRPRARGNDLVVDTGNKTKYGVWVQGPKKGSGPKQTRRHARTGWPSVTEVGEQMVRKHRPLIQAAMIGRKRP